VHAASEQQGKLPRELWHRGEADEAVLKGLLERHVKHTGSKRAKEMLDNWSEARGRFVKVFPKEYRRALGELAAANKKAAA
jgi:glutamate synthase domain-containing protein 3